MRHLTPPGRLIGACRGKDREADDEDSADPCRNVRIRLAAPAASAYGRSRVQNGERLTQRTGREAHPVEVDGS